MKKYVIAYFILFLILLGLRLTHGIPFGITVSGLDYSRAIIPGKSRNIMLIYNIVIMLACFVMAVILTNQKENVLKGKLLIPIIMFICFAFLPVGMSEEVRGIVPEYTKKFWTISSLIMRNMDRRLMICQYIAIMNIY